MSKIDTKLPFQSRFRRSLAIVLAMSILGVANADPAGLAAVGPEIPSEVLLLPDTSLPSSEPALPVDSDQHSFLLSAHSRMLPSRRRLGKRKARRRI